MARWQDLCRMMLDETIPPGEILTRLNVTPSRLRQMLQSRRLKQRLEATTNLTERVQTERLVKNMEQVSRRLIDMSGSDKPETARRACKHLLAECQRTIAVSRQPKFIPDWMR